MEQSNRSIEEVTAPLKEAVAKYSWYHIFELGPGVETHSRDEATWEHENHKRFFAWLKDSFRIHDFKGKRFLDVGCADGMLSFEALRLGAQSGVAIDKELSQAATEFLIHHFGVNEVFEMHKCSVYELTPARFGLFDLVIAYGLVYHLRFPFYGLYLLSKVLPIGGKLLLELGLYDNRWTEDVPLLVCPIDGSPYENSSCSFFNQKGLDDTMLSLGFKRWSVIRGDYSMSKNNITVTRFAVSYVKTHEVNEWLSNYWFAGLQ